MSGSVRDRTVLENAGFDIQAVTFGTVHVEWVGGWFRRRVKITAKADVTGEESCELRPGDRADIRIHGHQVIVP